MKPHRYIFTPLLHSVGLPLMFLAFLAAGCGEGSGGKRPAGDAAVLAEAWLVRPEPHTVRIRATGDLLPREEVEIKAPVAGNVRAIRFREGQRVATGALLVEIDDRNWVAQKKGLEARLLSAESELHRKKKLLAVNGVSVEEVEQSTAEVDGLKAQIEALAVTIDLAAVRAPFAGRLGMRNFSTGAWLTQGSVITRLVQTDGMKVNFTIPAQYAAAVATGQAVTVISSNGRDTAMARVYAVDPRISSTSRSLQLRALLDGTPRGFVPGDFVQVHVDVERKDAALLVPAESIIPELNTMSVYILRDGIAVRREVTTGSRTDTRVEILDGIAPGDTVLTSGLMGVREGSPVTLQKLHGTETE
ncbi:MAG: efflux RND transporter periplasmic adaptor subunit [Bacteroidota bacterium]|nr:efflux RND transporter periplasmic adaptor subunit [Bacteroidota bacterium]